MRRVGRGGSQEYVKCSCERRSHQMARTSYQTRRELVDGRYSCEQEHGAYHRGGEEQGEEWILFECYSRRGCGRLQVAYLRR